MALIVAIIICVAMLDFGVKEASGKELFELSLEDLSSVDWELFCDELSVVLLVVFSSDNADGSTLFNTVYVSLPSNSLRFIRINGTI